MLSSILSTSLFAALLTGDVICATPLQDNDQTTAYAVREQHPVPRGWTVVGEAPKDRMLQMHIGLSEEKPGQLESELLEGGLSSDQSRSFLDFYGIGMLCILCLQDIHSHSYHGPRPVELTGNEKDYFPKRYRMLTVSTS